MAASNSKERPVNIGRNASLGGEAKQSAKLLGQLPGKQRLPTNRGRGKPPEHDEIVLPEPALALAIAASLMPRERGVARSDLRRPQPACDRWFVRQSLCGRFGSR